MQPKLRIAFGRFMQESNSFSPILTKFSDFTHYTEGNELLQACQRGNWEIKGFLRNLELSGFIRAVTKYQQRGKNIEPVPILSTWAISGGALEKEAFEEICRRWAQGLQAAGRLDGVFIALHGALDVQGMEEPEARFLEITREIVGNEIPIAITLDMHAVLTPAKLSPATIVCGYRTNPHRDFARTGFRAGELLIRTLLGEIRPVYTWRSLPMMVGGGAGVDFLPPSLGLFRRMNAMERQHKEVLYCNIYICHPFLNHPDIGWSVYVLTNDNQELAEKLADELAERCWSVRLKRYDNFYSIEEAIQRARRAFFARKLGTITISDTSDVVAAGGTGENTQVLRALLEKGKGMISYVPLRDPEVVLSLWETPIGTEVSPTVGGKIQPEYNPPLTIKGKIWTKKETKDFGKVVVLDLGDVKLVLTEGAALALKPSFYRDLGLNVWKPDITVVKSFFHFRIYYFFISRRTFYVRTRGITDFDITHSIFTNDPVYPKDEIEDWREVDARRRGVKFENRKIYFSLNIKA